MWVAADSLSCSWQPSAFDASGLEDAEFGQLVAINHRGSPCLLFYFSFRSRSRNFVRRHADTSVRTKFHEYERSLSVFLSHFIDLIMFGRFPLCFVKVYFPSVSSLDSLQLLRNFWITLQSSKWSLRHFIESTFIDTCKDSTIGLETVKGTVAFSVTVREILRWNVFSVFVLCET